MMNVTKKRVKGFTLIELIVVIAIIGVLLGVIAPNLLSTYRKSRVNSANADAKMVYNAAQTEVMRFMSRDRCSKASEQSGFGSVLWISYEPGVGLSYSTQPTLTGSSSLTVITQADANSATMTSARAAYEVGTRINRVVSGARDVNWAIRVDNYIVKASVSSPLKSSSCIGYYSANKVRAEGYSDGSYSTKFVQMLNTYSLSYSSAGTQGTADPQKPIDPPNGN